VVTIKQVPDTKAVTAKAMKDDGTVNRAALPAIFNPEDLNALEAALQVKDTYGGTVTVITMGPPAACEILRESLYRGADRAILLSDRRAAASDTLATSYILNCAVRKLGKVDLVFCGRQAIDGDTAQVGPQMAEKLGFPQITYLEELQGIKDGKITVKRNTGHGWQVVSCTLPALVTVMDTANVPRYAGAKNMMKYKKARASVELGDQAEAVLPKLREKGLELEVWDLTKIDADLKWCGREGSPTKVHRIQAVVLKGGGHKTVEPTEDGIKSLIHELIEDHTLG
jgi:electron transfer flavoprotein beta subunit